MRKLRDKIYFYPFILINNLKLIKKNFCQNIFSELRFIRIFEERL